jgi:hypothetical protein
MGPIDIPVTWDADFFPRFTNVPQNDHVPAPYVPNITASSRLSVISPTGEVERVCLWSPPVHERGNQRGVVAEPRQPLRLGNLNS